MTLLDLHAFGTVWFYQVSCKIKVNYLSAKEEGSFVHDFNLREERTKTQISQTAVKKQRLTVWMTRKIEYCILLTCSIVEHGSKLRR